MDNRKQFNVRIDERIAKAVDKLKKNSRYTREDISETIFGSFLGSQDPEIQARKEKLERLVKDLRLSFLRADSRSVGQRQEQLAA